MKKTLVSLLLLLLVYCLFAATKWEVGVYEYNSETYIASEWQTITFEDQQVRARIMIDRNDIRFELEKNLYADNWSIDTKTSGGTTHGFKAVHVEPCIITVIPEDSDRLFADLLVGVNLYITSDTPPVKHINYGWVKVDATTLRKVWK